MQSFCPRTSRQRAFVGKARRDTRPSHLPIVYRSPGTAACLPELLGLPVAPARIVRFPILQLDEVIRAQFSSDRRSQALTLNSLLSAGPRVRPAGLVGVQRIERRRPLADVRREPRR